MDNYSWSEIQPEGNVNNWWIDSKISSDGSKLFAASQYNGSTPTVSGYLYYSTDKGLTWANISPKFYYSGPSFSTFADVTQSSSNLTPGTLVVTGTPLAEIKWNSLNGSPYNSSISISYSFQGNNASTTGQYFGMGYTTTPGQPVSMFCGIQSFDNYGSYPKYSRLFVLGGPTTSNFETQLGSPSYADVPFLLECSVSIGPKYPANNNADITSTITAWDSTHTTILATTTGVYTQDFGSYNQHFCFAIDDGPSLMSAYQITAMNLVLSGCHRNWNCICMSQDGTQLYAAETSSVPYGTGTGRIFYSSNSGASWLELFPDGATDQEWHCIACNYSGSTIILGGGTFAHSYLVYISYNYGSSWITKDVSGGGPNQWQTAAMNSTGQTMMIMSGARLYVSTNTGGAWSQVLFNGLHNYYSGSACGIDHSGNYMMASSKDETSTYQVIWISNNAGSTWTKYLQGTQNSTPGACDNNFVNLIYCGGRMTGGAGASYVNTSKDGGNTWTQESYFPTPRSWTTVSISGDGTTAVAGEAGTRLYLGIPSTIYVPITGTLLNSNFGDVTPILPSPISGMAVSFNKGTISSSRVVRLQGSQASSYSESILSVNFSVDRNRGAFPLIVQFTNLSTGDFTSVLYDFGDGTTSTQQNPTHTYLRPGSYTVSLTVYDATQTKTVPGMINVVARPSTQTVLKKGIVNAVVKEKWRGLAIPLVQRVDGHWSSRPTRELVISSIFHILTTRIGSKLMDPTFGASFLDIIFEQNDGILKSEAITYVTTAITKFEPRVAVQQVDVVQSGQNMELILDYLLVETGEPVNAAIQFNKFSVDSISVVRF